jgi:hypothetical protein
MAMHIPDWLTFALRILVLIALIPAAVQAFRQPKGGRVALLTVLTLLLICGCVFVLVSLLS